MAAFCLPKKETAAFIEALQNGTIDPEKLMDMSSAERHELFDKIVGPDNAREVNAQFEAKMLLKDQKKGLISWASKIAGLTDTTRSDIVAKISKLDRVLQPAEEKEFLADLAAKKLGVTVSADEAKGIFDLSQVAEAKRATMMADISNVDNRIAYGRALMDLQDEVEKLKPGHMSWSDRLIDVLNIPKSALTSVLHLSAPFVQGWGMMTTQRAWQGFGQMFRYFASEENYKNLNAYIISHPDWPLARDGKLGITKLGDKLSMREEAIQSTLVEAANKWLSDKTGVPNLVRASGRAFTGYLNYVRFNRFTDLLNAARANGEDVRVGSPVVRDLAKVVNDFTGRGAIGKDDVYASVTPALNAAFFSPRKISATMEMFDPIRYLNPAISPTARIAAVRQLSGSLIATGAVLGLAKAMGANVSWDPRSSDFAKIDINGEKLDMTGGNSIYLRLLARLATNQEVTANGKLIQLGQGYKPTTRADLALHYIRGKLSPIASAIADSLYGTDPVGRPFSVTQEMRDKLMPITMQSFLNYAQNDAGNTAAIIPALSAIFGVGLESPLPPLVKSGRNVWGEPGSFGPQAGDPVDQQFKTLGYTPGYPPETIRGVKLTDGEYDDYVRLSGRLAHMRLESLVEDLDWNARPGGQRLELMKHQIDVARKFAQSAIMMKEQGGSHDIMALATAAKLARMNATPDQLRSGEFAQPGAQ